MTGIGCLDVSRRLSRVALALAALLTGLFVLATPAAAAPAPTAAAPAATQDTEVTLTLFWDYDCPKCEAEREFLAGFQQEHPTLRIEQYELHEPANRERFTQTMSQLGLEAESWPTTIVGERVWIGFTDPIRDDIRRVVEGALRGEPVPKGVYGTPGEGTCEADTNTCAAPEQTEPTTVNVPLLGDIDVGSQSLVVSTLVIGFVDGINPCSLWVISILLAIVIRTGSRRRVMAVGSAFLVVTAGMYGLYMVGIYSALSVIGYLGAIQIIVGLAAGVFGVLAVKDYFWFKQGPSMSIPEGSKPGLYRRMREVAGSRSLPAALGATTLLAVAVSLLETPCTAGFPVIWTGLLAANDVSTPAAVLLFLLYMLPFLLDELLVFGVAVATMRASKLQEKHGRVLKLVAGVFMLALAGTMIVRPSIMESPLGATIVFLVATAVALGTHLIATRTTWFTDLARLGRRGAAATWRGVEPGWRRVQPGVSAVGTWTRDTLWGRWMKPAWDSVSARTPGWLKDLPGQTWAALVRLGRAVVAPVRAGRSTISAYWNGRTAEKPPPTE